MIKKRPALWVAPFLIGFALPLTSLAAGGGDGSEHHGYNYVHMMFQTFNVIVFFGTLAYILKSPIGGYFSNRVQAIREALAKAENSRETAKQRLDEIESKMSNLDREVAEIESKAKEELEREKASLEAAAKEDAARIVEQAKAEIDHMTREAVLELKGYVTDMALESAEQRIRESITEQERKQLFVEFTERLGAK